jgi:hypothetical protein
MIIQVQDLIKAALQDIGAIGKNEPITASDANDALQKLNFMIDAWSVRSLMVLGAIMESFPLTAGQGAYTIGIGANFNTTKPSKITDAYVRDGYNIDTPVDVVGQDEYDSYEDKIISQARPIALYYDPGYTQQSVQTGTIYLYYIPDASTPYTLFIGQQKALTEFSAITDTVTFQSAYYEALEYNLAVRLWPQYHDSGKPVSADLHGLALESLNVIETMNTRIPKAAIETPGRKTIYNIYTGEYQ